MSPGLILLIIVAFWSVNAVLFLVATGKIYFSREGIPRRRPQENDALPFLSVIIPARNEEHNIGNCLKGLAASDYPPGKLQIIVVNDRSTDSTVAIVEEYASTHPHIELVQGNPLPDGWTGKVHGCWQGAEHARGEWLVFLDADSTVKPGLLYSAVSFATQKQLELLTLIPFQIAESAQERIWLPGVFFGFSSFLDLKRINDPNDPYAIANGQFLLFAKEAYDRFDGHRAIKNELNDDIALARAAKQHGLRFQCAFAEQLLETRMYHNLKEIWNGFSRNTSDITQTTSFGRLIANALHTSSIAVGFLVLPFIVGYAYLASPAIDTLLSFWLCIPVALLLLLSFIMVVEALRIPRWYGLSVPLGLLLQGALCVRSYRLTNRGIREWKGRTYSS